MRKLFTFIASVAVLSFTACSSGAKPSTKSGLEGTKVSTYLVGKYVNESTTKSKLESAGFEVIASYPSVKKGTTLVFTNDALKAEASKENRGFAGVEKVLISENDNQLIFTNPELSYFKEILESRQEQIAKNITTDLESEFGKMEASSDVLEDDDIAGYHFMMGMPYYEDMIEIAQGDNLSNNLELNAGNNIVFKLKLQNSTLFGIAMPTEDGEASYIPEIKGQKHSVFLPYMVLIEDSKAKILHAKYYLAISYPNLSMGDFMGISSTPGAIEDYMTSLMK